MGEERKRPSKARRIPSAEDFARAHAQMEVELKFLSEVRERACRSLAGRAPLHTIYLFGSPTADYDAFVFLESDADIEAGRTNGNEQVIQDAILEAFAAASADKRTPPTVAFKFDSHENVKRTSNGSYARYLR